MFTHQKTEIPLTVFSFDLFSSLKFDTLSTFSFFFLLRIFLSIIYFIY